MLRYSVVIPAHNEALFISKALNSVVLQTILPEQLIIVDDNSTDETFEIANTFSEKYAFVKVIQNASSATHLPGSKVIRAFQKGFDLLEKSYDIIVKLDADIILPLDYFEVLLSKFESDPCIGIAGGFAQIEVNGKWQTENLTDKDHVRGAFKAYRKACFDDIGGLKPAMGWDTVDELLAKFYNWKVVTIETLLAKHLKPTGANYNKAARYKQGEAFYSLGYGFLITVIASAKLSWMKQKPLLFPDYIRGFLQARSAKKPLLVTEEQAQFIRNYRLDKMKKKIMR